MLTHLSLRLRIFLFFALIALGGAVLIIAGLTFAYLRLADPETLSTFILGGFIAILALLGLTTWIWVLFDENVARPVERLAADLRARAHADVAQDLDHSAARYLGDLGGAAAAVSANLVETRNAMALEVGRETARLAVEKSRLETLLSEAPDGILFCSPDHAIALYNPRAAELLDRSEALGLNRPLHHLILPGPIAMAYERLVGEGGSDSADILLATRSNARLLQARMTLLKLEGQDTVRPGYLLSLRDVSDDLALHRERTGLLDQLLSGLSEVLPALPPAERERLAALVSDVTEQKAASEGNWWPKEALPLSDFAAALTARAARKGVALAADLPDTQIEADGFALVTLFERVGLSWAGHGASGLTLSAAANAGAATITLSADAPLPPWEMVEDWLAEPLSPGLSNFAGRDVLASHGATLTSDERAVHLRLPLATPAPALARRPMQYDFDLLHADLPEALSEARLSQLNFVIFDTETTGLNPAVDEICQIAAVRVVNGRLRADERFDMLVNPGRPIPAASTAVHHITDEMVADAPDVAEALTRFHRFADNNILVAHNAPFDMAFLRRREAQIGRQFDQPILDTVLFSAILFGQSAEHTLDALCERLTITIPEEDRHTAIGDAIGTGDAFARMIPMMEAAELLTLGQTIAAFDQHKRLIEHLN